jgi:hypothetical protein
MLDLHHVRGLCRQTSVRVAAKYNLTLVRKILFCCCKRYTIHYYSLHSTMALSIMTLCIMTLSISEEKVVQNTKTR